MRLAVALFGTVAALTGCDTTSPDERTFATLRVYKRDRFRTAQECEAAQAAGEGSCVQEARFCPDGRADLRLTDDLLAAEYGIRGNRLTLRFAVNQGTPPEMSFTVSLDQSELIAVETGDSWSRNPEREGAMALAGLCT